MFLHICPMAQLVSIKNTDDTVVRLTYEVDTHEHIYQVYGADWHIDSKHCCTEQLKSILDFCLKHNIIVHHIGDLFDVMQGRNDKRGSKSSLIPELQGGDYFTRVLDYAENFFAPYASILGVFSYGNHETAITTKVEIDLLAMFVQRMKTIYHSPIKLGGYSGYILTSFLKRGQNKTIEATMTAFFRHSGGSRGVETGSALSARRMPHVGDADMYFSGDTHQGYIIPRMRTRNSALGKFEQYLTWHISIPCMKDEYVDGWGGWHIETDKEPRPRGIVLVRFFREGSKNHLIAAEPMIVQTLKDANIK